MQAGRIWSLICSYYPRDQIILKGWSREQGMRLSAGG